MIPYFIGLLANIAAFFAAENINDIVAGAILMIAAVVLTICFYRKDQCLVSFRVLLSLSWIGGEGLAAMRLSHLQTEWTKMTWISFTLFYLIFLLGYEIGMTVYKRRTKSRNGRMRLFYYHNDPQIFQERLFRCIVIMTIVSTGVFLLEAAILGYIPVFSKETHAYDHFHITGLHYFTVSCMFVPALSVIYLLEQNTLSKQRKRILWICNIAAFCIPIGCVSKFMFVLAVVQPAILYLLMRPSIPVKRLIIGGGTLFITIAAAAVVLTLSRHYEPGYLNGIFEMRNENTPVWFQYVYMYIANNYANFNELTKALQAGTVAHTMGLRQLFPVFALTGMKFVFPQLVSFAAPVTKETLNTLTMIYDAFYDFGIAGVIGFAGILGGVCGMLTMNGKTGKNPIRFFFYSQLAMYIMLSFFSSWFTVPTTWFWFALTAMMYGYTSIARRK